MTGVGFAIDTDLQIEAVDGIDAIEVLQIVHYPIRTLWIDDIAKLVPFKMSHFLLQNSLTFF